MNLLEHESLNTDTRMLLLGQVGSKAYGTSTPESDDDYMGAALAPLSFYTGLKNWKNDGTLEMKRASGQEVDASVYELKKFFKLCLEFNPNVIPLLYLRKEDYRLISPEGELILANRDMFTSKLALTTFVGYAKGQLDSVKRSVTGKYGEKRKALIAQYGYDIKFAYHTIRLLGMIEEFFETGLMNVWRSEQIPLLMSIRRGEWKQEQFFGLAEQLLFNVEETFKDQEWIPDKPDYQKANDVCMAIVEMGKF